MASTPDRDPSSLSAARRALACLDLTSLNLDDTPERIAALCDRALRPGPGVDGHPAAVCVYPRFVAQCVAAVSQTAIKVAAVANFPTGEEPLDDVLAQVNGALDDGAGEIDVVLPFRAYLRGERDTAQNVIETVAHACKERDTPATLKVILETGALGTPEIMTAAALDAIAWGADFVKTSTGKLEPGATPQAAEALLQAVTTVRERDGRQIGVKVSGGVRTVGDAAGYFALADRYLDPDEAGPANFRFGASGLLDDIVATLTGAATKAPSAPANY